MKLNTEQATLARDALAPSSKISTGSSTRPTRAPWDPRQTRLNDGCSCTGSSHCAQHEQLCINFANEKLQQFFLKFIFKAEEDLYTFENVSWTRIEYQDNQGCIDLIEKSPTGIMRLLDETCKKPNSSDKQFCESVSNTHKRNDFYMEPRAAGQKQYRPDEAFVVRHFAGDVCYQGVMFCEKNNDTLHSDFSEEMGKASQQVLAFCSHPRSPSFAELAPRLTLPHARNPGAPPPDTGRGVRG